MRVDGDGFESDCVVSQSVWSPATISQACQKRRDGGAVIATAQPSGRIGLRNQPDLLASSIDKTVTLTGDFDGQFLSADLGKVLVQPRSALKSGRYRVMGRVQLPTWYRNPGAFDLGAWLESRGVHYAFRVQAITR